jgi:putative oligomerization/nucleic acid binding protein
MATEDMIGEKFRAPRHDLRARLTGIVFGKPASGSLSEGAHFELSSLDMLVGFYEDRLEYHRRLGSKHGVIPYRDIRAARLVKKVPLSVSIGNETFGASRSFSKKLILHVVTLRRPLVFDFRTEPLEDVQRALELVTDQLNQSRDRDASSTPVGRSRADELAKLAELRASGVLSDDEFEREKSRLLNS